MGITYKMTVKSHISKLFSWLNHFGNRVVLLHESTEEHKFNIINKSAAGMHDTPPSKFNLVQMHGINLQYQTTSSRYELLNKV